MILKINEKKLLIVIFLISIILIDWNKSKKKHIVNYDFE